MEIGRNNPRRFSCKRSRAHNPRVQFYSYNRSHCRLLGIQPKLFCMWYLSGCSQGKGSSSQDAVARQHSLRKIVNHLSCLLKIHRVHATRNSRKHRRCIPGSPCGLGKPCDRRGEKRHRQAEHEYRRVECLSRAGRNTDRSTPERVLRRNGVGGGLGVAEKEAGVKKEHCLESQNFRAPIWKQDPVSRRVHEPAKTRELCGGGGGRAKAR